MLQQNSGLPENQGEVLRPLEPKPTPRHIAFLRELKGSRAKVYAVAMWMGERGWDIMVPATHYAPTADQHELFSDNGDLFIKRSTEAEWLQIAVRGIKRHFTGYSDWPWRHRDEIYVDTVAAIDKMGDKIFSYITVNPAMTAIAIIEAKTRKHWYRKDVECADGRILPVWACSLRWAKFTSITGGGDDGHKRRGDAAAAAVR